MKALDISYHQDTKDYNKTTVDFGKVKKSGIDYIVLRASYGTSIDKRFEDFYRRCQQANIVTDVYHYSYAKNAGEAVLAAQTLATALRGKDIKYIFWDFEEGFYQNYAPAQNTAIYRGFKSWLEGLGYKVGIYFNGGFSKLINIVDDEIVWFAGYPLVKNISVNDLTPAYPAKYVQAYNPHGTGKTAAWQYSSKCIVDGIPLNTCDISEIYSPELIGRVTGAPISAPSPTPDAVSHKTLRKGSKGDEVKVLQTALNKHGYNLSADGDFGNKTLAAVLDYQAKNGLAADGIVGIKTWGKLV